MLYDPKWEVPVKTKPDLAEFVAFAAAQPVGSTFNIDKPQECALGQYFKAVGEKPLVLVDDAAQMFGMETYELYRILWGSGGRPIVRFDGIARRGKRFLRPSIWSRVRAIFV
jgi:hypothetical protein